MIKLFKFLSKLAHNEREHVFLFQRILKAHKLVSMEVRVLGI
jgi:hypothetical protein